MKQYCKECEHEMMLPTGNGTELGMYCIFGEYKPGCELPLICLQKYYRKYKTSPKWCPLKLKENDHV
jgi:hypothetical protein